MLHDVFFDGTLQLDMYRNLLSLSLLQNELDT